MTNAPQKTPRRFRLLRFSLKSCLLFTAAVALFLAGRSSQQERIRSLEVKIESLSKAVETTEELHTGQYIIRLTPPIQTQPQPLFKVPRSIDEGMMIDSMEIENLPFR